jgi:hypothetical protein
MSDTIITVENLSKSYLVGHKSGALRAAFRTSRPMTSRNAV